MLAGMDIREWCHCPQSELETTPELRATNLCPSWYVVVRRNWGIVWMRWCLSMQSDFPGLFVADLPETLARMDSCHPCSLHEFTAIHAEAYSFHSSERWFHWR